MCVCFKMFQSLILWLLGTPIYIYTSFKDLTPCQLYVIYYPWTFLVTCDYVFKVHIMLKYSCYATFVHTCTK